MFKEKLNAMKRIKDEYTELSNNYIESIGATVGLVDPDNLFEWKCTLTGPADTSYRGGVFLLRIKFPNNYPTKAPEIVFRTPIYHVNVNPRKISPEFANQEGAESLGHVCISTLNYWNPNKRIMDALKEIFYLFYSPNASSPYGLDRADELLYNRPVYEEKIKYFTNKYANPQKLTEDYDKDWDFTFP